MVFLCDFAEIWVCIQPLFRRVRVVFDNATSLLTLSVGCGMVLSSILPVGGVAQLVEHLICIQDVAGSIPVASTTFLAFLMCWV